MAQITDLPPKEKVSDGDSLPIFEQISQTTKRITAALLRTYFSQPYPPTILNRTPTNGSTLDLSTFVSGDNWVCLNHMGTLSTLTIQLALASGIADGTSIQINTTVAVTAITWNANQANLVGIPTSLSTNGYFSIRYNAGIGCWMRSA